MLGNEIQLSVQADKTDKLAKRCLFYLIIKPGNTDKVFAFLTVIQKPWAPHSARYPSSL